MREKFNNLICRINFRTIFLILLVSILILRFGIKMLNNYLAWDFFPTHYAAKYILAKKDIYCELAGTSSQYTRSPTFALMLHPLGLLPRNIASFLWCLLSIVSLGSIFVISEKLFLKPNNKKNLFWICVAPLAITFLSRPLISEFLLGQVDILMLFFIMFALFFKEKNKLVLSALFLAIAVSIKLTPLIFLLYFLFKKEIKLASLVIFFMAIFLFMPTIFVSWNQNLLLLGGWYHNLKYFYLNDNLSFQGCWFQSLLFFFKRFLFSDNFNLSLFKAPPEFAKYLNYLTFLAVFIFLILKPKNLPKDIKIPTHIIDYNILIICMVIFSPLAADYTYINLIVPIMFLIYLFQEEKLYKKPIFSISAILFLIFNFFTSTKAFRLIGIYSIQREGYCYLVVMTLVWQALILLYLLSLLKYKISPEK